MASPSAQDRYLLRHEPRHSRSFRITATDGDPDRPEGSFVEVKAPTHAGWDPYAAEPDHTGSPTYGMGVSIHTGRPASYGEVQGTLFDTVGEDRPPVVEELGRTGRGAHTVPALLGLAARESLRRWGRMPTHSMSLSDQSRGLVERLTGRGVIEQHPQVSEGYHPTDNHLAGNYGWGQSNVRFVQNLPSTELDPRVGQQFVRHLLRRPKPPAPERHEQLGLF